MPIIDAAAGAFGPLIETDLCIIGGGPAGLALAFALQGSRERITLVESGGLDPDPALQALNEIEQLGDGMRQDFMSRVRLLGGASNLWPGRCMRLRPEDLAPRDWLPQSGWPIRYEGLARYYPAAAGLLRLPAAAREDSHAPPTGDAEAALTASADLVVDRAWWGKSPLRFGPALRPLFAGAEARTLLLNLTALEIRLDANQGRVIGIRAANLHGRAVELRARRYVLACGGIENARLLLASNAQARQGVGNAHDQVGRCYMDHPRAVAARLRLSGRAELGRLLGLPLPDGRLKLGLSLSPACAAAAGLPDCLLELEPAYAAGSTLIYGSALEVVRRVYRRRFGHPDQTIPWSAAGRYLYQLTLREVMPHRLYQLLHLMRKRQARELVAVVHCEQAPDPANRITLTGVLDPLGLPRACLTWRVGTAERQSARLLLETLDRQCRRLGLGALLDDGGAEPAFGDAAHPMGTTRMSTDPRHGVVDADCRVHELTNLYLAGSSVFPTGGYANPTWTIVALALRLADHLQRQAEHP
jgi:choline dehydrogenase-like flavoprotein